MLATVLQKNTIKVDDSLLHLQNLWLDVVAPLTMILQRAEAR